MPSILNRLPIFTNIGFAKVQAAIQNGTKVTLSQIALGDAINDIEYSLNPAMTALNHELMRINVRSKIIDDTTFFETLVLRVFGTLVAKDAIDMVIREIGIYDTDGDLIIITRTNNVTTMSPEALRTGVELDIGKKIDANAKDVFEVDYTNNTDGVLRYELTAHIEQFVDPHKTTKFQIGLGNVEDVADEDMALSNNLLELIMDSEMATGFVDIDNSILSVAGTVLTLNNTLVSDVYRRGILFSLPVGAINIDLATEYGEYYIGLNPILNTLYRINVLDIVNDIPVAFVSVNSIDGIVIYTDERHSASKNNRWYQLEEKTNSISMVSGGKLTGLVGNENVSITISAPVRVFNKDLDFTVTDTAVVGNYNQVLTNAKIPVMYIGVDSVIRESKTNLAAGPWLYNANGLLVNDTTTGLLNELGDNKYINYYLVVTADVRAPIKLVIGHKEHTTLDAAMSEDKDDNVILDRINILEAYRITLKKNSTVANVFKAKIESIVLLLEKTGLRNAFTALSHNDLGSSRFEPDQHGIDNFLGLRELLDAASSQAETEEGILSIDFNGNLQSDLSVFTGTGATIETRQADRRKIPTLYGGAGGEELLQCKFIGDSYTGGGGQWSQGVKADNGKIYYPPTLASKVLCVDPNNDTTSLVGADYTTAYSKWLSAAKAPNGKIYCAPYSAYYVLKIDPLTDTAVGIGADLGAATGKYYMSIAHPNGKIYFPPFNSTRVLVVDPDTDSHSLMGTTYADSAKWAGGALALNGHIYCPPYTTGKVLKIDVNAGTTTLIGTDYGTTAGKWHSAILAPNGKIYCPQNYGAQVLVIDPATDTTSLIGPSYSTASGKYIAGALGLDGKIYCPPYTSVGQFLIIDPATDKVYTAGPDLGPATASKFAGIVLADNGAMYSAPYAFSYVLKLDFIDKTKNYSNIIVKTKGSVNSAGQDWQGYTLGSDGKIYGSPNQAATNFVHFDPVTGVTATIGASYGTASSKWLFGIATANGKIYFPPYSVGQAAVIDVLTKTVNVIGTSYGTAPGKWANGVLAPNGKIYCPPGNAGNVLCIDTNNNTTSLIGSYLGVGNYFRYAGNPILAPNGKIYCAPYDTIGQILCIDPSNDTTYFIGPSNLTGYGTLHLTGNGKIISKSSSDNFLIIDPTDESVTITTFPEIKGNNWCSYVDPYTGLATYIPTAVTGAKRVISIDIENNVCIISRAFFNVALSTSATPVLAPNGKLYHGPAVGSQIVEIDIVDKATDYGAYLKIGIDSTKIVP